MRKFVFCSCGCVCVPAHCVCVCVVLLLSCSFTNVWINGMSRVCLLAMFVGCLTSQQHASVSQDLHRQFYMLPH